MHVSMIQQAIHTLQFAADVLGCTINTDSGMVEVLDTWNVAQGRNNVLDTVQDAFLFSGRSANGRISCRYDHAWTTFQCTMLSYYVFLVLDGP